MANIYFVHEANLEEFYKKMDTLKKKCDKVGASCSYKIVGFEYHTELDEEDMQPYTVKYYQVEAEGVAVIEGWEIVAVVEYINGSSIVTLLNDDVEIPARYYDGDNSCEHCNSIRPRKTTCCLLLLLAEFADTVSKTFFATALNAQKSSAILLLKIIVLLPIVQKIIS